MYLPSRQIDQTKMPVAYGPDLFLAVDKIAEQYRRFRTQLQYFSLKAISITRREPREPDNPTDDTVVGTPGTTAFDPVWGEAVDSSLAGQPWQQPQLSGSLVSDVDSIDQFNIPVTIPMKVQKTALDTELKKWGFDRVRDLIVTIPVSFDDNGITSQPGDKIQWDADDFNILQRTLDGFWHATNIRMFMVCNCEHRRKGLDETVFFRAG